MHGGNVDYRPCGGFLPSFELLLCISDPSRSEIHNLIHANIFSRRVFQWHQGTVAIIRVRSTSSGHSPSATLEMFRVSVTAQHNGQLSMHADDFDGLRRKKYTRIE